MTGDWDRSDSKRVCSRGCNNKHGHVLDMTMRTWTGSGNPGRQIQAREDFPILKAESQG